jgi:hypothetical protein
VSCDILQTVRVICCCQDSDLDLDYPSRRDSWIETRMYTKYFGKSELFLSLQTQERRQEEWNDEWPSQEKSFSEVTNCPIMTVTVSVTKTQIRVILVRLIVSQAQRSRSWLFHRFVNFVVWGSSRTSRTWKRIRMQKNGVRSGAILKTCLTKDLQSIDWHNVQYSWTNKNRKTLKDNLSSPFVDS